MGSPVIRVFGLSRNFGTRQALNGLSMEVEEGIIYGFLGPNGAGKTTTIRLLLGLILPTAGTADVLGHDIRLEAQKIRERCGTLLEHTGLYERLSVYDNLEFHARSRGLRAAERRARIGELLERFELSDRKKDPAGKLSKGMKQKLAIARAILHRPSLVFLDEPSSGLDIVSATKLHDDISRLAADEGTTVFLTTHNLSEAEKLCARIGVIRSGTLIFSGTPADLKSSTGSGEISIETTSDGSGNAHRAVPAGLEDDLRLALPGIRSARVEGTRILLTTAPGTSAAPAVDFLVRRGIGVEEVRKGKASLEQAFLDLLTAGEREVQE